VINAKGGYVAFISTNATYAEKLKFYKDQYENERTVNSKLRISNNDFIGQLHMAKDELKKLKLKLVDTDAILNKVIIDNKRLMRELNSLEDIMTANRYGNWQPNAKSI
jgi:hypothetical protein